MNRREFLKGSLGLGAVMATANLPSVAKDDPSAFAKRGRWERLSVAFGAVESGRDRARPSRLSAG